MSDASVDQRRAELRRKLLGSLGARAEHAAPAPPAVRPADPAEQSAPFPMLDLQRAYWLGRAVDGVACHGYLELDVEDLDVDRFTGAFQQLIRRHPALRSVFDGDGRQRCLPAEELRHEIPLVDLRQAADREATLERIRREMSHQLLPADRWPLFDVRVTRTSERRWRINLSVDILIADAQSFQILARELLTWYADPAAELPPIDLTFRDYVLATRSGGADLARAEAYWRDRVRELPPAPDLPLGERSGPPAFRRVETFLPGDTWSAVVAAGRARGLSPAAVTLAAFTEALGVWAASPRFTVNLTQFNREPVHPHVDRVVGSFTNNTLVDVDLGTGASFAEFGAAVQRRMWECLEHRALSGVRILRELQRARGAAEMPVVFTYVQSGDDDFRTRLGALGEVVYAISQTPQVTLDCQASESGDGLNLWWDADERVFPGDSLDELFRCFVDLLSRLGDDDVWRAVNPAASPAGVATLRRGTQREAPVPELSLWDLFVRSAERRPDAVAVVEAGQEITYARLLAASRDLAARLRGQDAAGLVAVHVERGWRQVAALLGVLGAGCAYLPVDRVLPAERVRRLLELGEVRLVVADGDVPVGPWSPVPVDAAPSVAVAHPGGVGAGEPRLAGPSGGDLAYVIFTSGSTGDPKGVRLRHDAVVNTVLDVNERFGVDASDRVLGLSSVGFDLSVWDVLGTLAAGGTLVTTAPGHAAKDPVRWLAQLREQRISVWNSVPALMDLLATEAERRGAVLPDLRLVLLSGDWIPLDLPERIRRIAPAARVISLGGATEAAIWSVSYEVGAVEPGWTSIPYGFPLTNQTLTVVDWAGRERPVGAVGELVIGGRGVADGYWNAPALTEAAFPVGADGRVYRTGDHVRRHADGILEFLGRVDGQVKIQGHRIELAEIDAALLRRPGVRAAVTEAVGPRDGHRRLVSVVVADDTVSVDALRDDLAAVLPPYMVPSRILVRPQLPATHNGKIDRAAVRELAAAEAGAAPRTPDDPATGPTGPGPVARHVLDVVRGHTASPGLGLHDDLLLAGMDSIHIVRLSGALERDLDFRPPLEEVLRTPTAATVAELFEHDVVVRLRSGQRFGRAGVEQRALTDAAERERFRAGIDRRPPVPPDAVRIPLAGLAVDRDDPVGRLLAVALPRLRDEGDSPHRPTRSYLTPGGIAAVRVHLWLPAPAGPLDRGLYALDPVAGDLVRVAPDAAVSGDGFDPFVYRPVFARSPFAVFLVADHTPYRTLYGAEGTRFAAMEAGALAQSLGEAMRPVALRAVPLVESGRLGVPGWGDDDQQVLQALLLDTTADAPVTQARAEPTSRPLTDSELRLWMYTRRHGPSPAYHISAVFRLTGPLDADRFAAALRHVVRRHPALRSAADESLPLLHTWPEATLDLRVVDVPVGASDAVVAQMIEEAAGRPFDILTPPLFRAVLLRRRATEHVAVLVVHHLVADDESIRIVGHETLSTYDGLADPDWSPPPAPAGDVAAVVARRAQLVRADPDGRARRREALLRTAAADDRLPAGGGGGRPWVGASQTVLFSTDERAAWERSRRELGVTTQVLELGLLALAVRAAGGPPESLVGMPDFGRDTAADWDAVGYFATTLLLRASLRGVTTFGELLAELRTESGLAQAAKHLQPEDLVGDRATARAGGFGLWLATYGEQEMPRLRELSVAPVPVDNHVARHDLRVGFFQRADGLGLHVTHRPGVLDARFVDGFTAALTRLHRAVPRADRTVEAVLDELRHEYGGAAMTELSDADLLPRAGSRRRRGARGRVDPVALSLPEPGAAPPLPVFEARLPAVDLATWIASTRDRVTGLLHEYGAVLIRGMAGTREGFPIAVRLVADSELLDYSNRSTPRSRVEGNVFTSTEYPADQVIPQHGEQAYTTRWPLVLGFRCEVAAASGGETPLASAAAVLSALPGELAARFAEQGVLYERWYHPHLDLPWSEVFQTDDRDEAEAAAAAAGIETAWFDGGVLRTRQRAQGVVTHPVTGQRLWFNQAQLFHPAALPAAMRAELHRSFGDRLPRNAYFGDGQPIPDADLAHVQRAFAAHTWRFPWREDDVLLVDNLAMTHGRDSFQGPRRVLVAMAGVGEQPTGGTR
ncbi:amino acid adenylation domain-containing protein [Micromonospora sp. URMC 107]|uniref:amino acid adenylation domain-containing protein n=1 Tax=Micromonospora sp. URMC 107 TaxID=3423418 RepID=UPI003F1E1D95